MQSNNCEKIKYHLFDTLSIWSIFSGLQWIRVDYHAVLRTALCSIGLIMFGIGN